MRTQSFLSKKLKSSFILRFTFLAFYPKKSIMRSRLCDLRNILLNTIFVRLIFFHFGHTTFLHFFHTVHCPLQLGESLFTSLSALYLERWYYLHARAHLEACTQFPSYTTQGHLTAEDRCGLVFWPYLVVLQPHLD